jgi:hypothetical protein
MIEPYGDRRRLGLVGHIGEFGYPLASHIVFLLTRVRPVFAFFDPNLSPLGALVRDVPTLCGRPRGVRGTYVWGTRL